MELPEIEQMVGEAENRVERLRSLYDQYFMGIERIEPQVARKDVERRIQMLRKVQIRNTALRFRFQNVVLRYNTFSAHWMRICRQIEEGTYKHHLRKAKEKLDPLEAARESREARKKAAALEYGDTEPPAAPSFDVMDDLEVEFEDDPVDRPETRAALRSYAIPTDVVAPSVAGRAIERMSAPSPPRRDASLDKRTDPAPPPGAVTVKAPPPPRAPAPPPAPGPTPPRPPPPVPARPAAPPLPPGARVNAPPGRPPPPPPQPPARASRPPSPRATKPPPPPPAAKPALKAPPPPAASPPKPVAAQARGASVDDRTRQIYAKYVETRRSLGESTAAITMDGLAKSLRDSSEKLRQKHPGKAVDFEVQVKDGKTVLKPIVR